jgi:histidinol-phosphatase (PHP family)
LTVFLGHLIKRRHKNFKQENLPIFNIGIHFFIKGFDFMTSQALLNSVPDYHIHSMLCKHANGDIQDYRKVARKRGILEICFSDHAPNPDGYDLPFRMEMDQFCDYGSMVKSQQDGEEPLALFGIEIDYYDGCEPFLNDWLPRQVFDLILGSVHYIDGWGFHDAQFKHLWDSVDVTATWKKYFSLIEKFINLELFDVVSHLDLPKSFGHRPPDKILKEMVQPVLDRIASAGMGIELNTRGLRKPVGEIYPSTNILALAWEREIPICFASDAHRPDEVGFGFERALQGAREAGYQNYFRIKERKKRLIPLPENMHNTSLHGL